MDASRNNLKLGETLALLLQGAWRPSPPPLALNAMQVQIAAPLALKGDGAALAYRRLRHVPEYASLAQNVLHADYVGNGVRAAALMHHLPLLVNALRDAGIEPLLFKGWAIARHYPELALRPIGDIDMFVPAAQFTRANAIAAELLQDTFHADIHTETQDAQHATRVTERTLDDLYAHSEQVELGSTQVRVLSLEDHLHLLCMHFLRHGGWRPLWLCDIAVALETRPREFDWERALGQGKTADWLTCVLGAAHQLLDAHIEGMPNATRAKNLPSWFLNAILEEWSDPDPARHHPPAPIRLVWKHPRRLAKSLRGRWFNPIESSVMLDAPFNETPRVWYQTRYWTQQGIRFVFRPR